MQDERFRLYVAGLVRNAPDRMLPQAMLEVSGGSSGVDVCIFFPGLYSASPAALHSKAAVLLMIYRDSSLFWQIWVWNVPSLTSLHSSRHMIHQRHCIVTGPFLLMTLLASFTLVCTSYDFEEKGQEQWGSLFSYLSVANDKIDNDYGL